MRLTCPEQESQVEELVNFRSLPEEQLCGTGHLWALRTLISSYLLRPCLSAPWSDQCLAVPDHSRTRKS